ncbi:MAG: hypothetical protein ACFFCE_01840 [Promethearchaeota archaeon]
MGKDGNYGLDYWNNKWKKNQIIYAKRPLRGDSYSKEISIDVKSFIKKNDVIIQNKIKEHNLIRNNNNDTAIACQNFVCGFLRYRYDDILAECPEFWQFPYETIQSKIGDCEDGAILMSSLMINAGIPSWRVKVCVGHVLTDPVFTLSETKVGGHAYCIYLADIENSDRKLEWVILDWCYLQDPELSIEEKPLARDGGQESAYKDIWFTFNDEFSWSPESFKIKSDRISKRREIIKEEALATPENLEMNN